MRIKEIQLRNFKRFTDTTITDVPSDARLILIVGPNGCGKSSVIDAANMWHRHYNARSGNFEEAYHRKQIPGITDTWNQLVVVQFHEPAPDSEDQKRKAIYARSAYRNDPDFQLSTLSHMANAVSEYRINRLIDNDQAVSLNYQRLVSQGFQDVFEREDPHATIGEFRYRLIGEISNAIKRLFPDLVLNSLGNPLSAGTFRFDKGDSKAFLYKNLSGGEKAAFDLLLDILVKRGEFDDTVFFIDEPEAHMSTALQSALLDELFRAIPANSQLWIATHSLAMMRRARDIGQEHSGSVVFLDFDGLNFDLPTVVRPAAPSRPFWKRAMQIALDDLAGYVAPEQVVLCEGGRVSGGRDFDADCYNEIFKVDYPQTVFLGAGNADDVQNDPRGVVDLLRALAPEVRIMRLIDRDDRTDDEIRVLQAREVRVLGRRTIESYLLDDRVLQSLCESFGQPELGAQLLQAKAQAVHNSISNGGMPDDFKRVAGDIFNTAKRVLYPHRIGGDNRAFMKGCCAPLIPQLPDLYRELRRDVFNE